MDFDATVAWPIYDWMGVAKAALESVARYLARDLGPEGIRVNLVSAGPLGTVAAQGIPGFEQLADLWRRQAPLGWDMSDPAPVARTICWLLSDYSQGISGEIVHVDGGFHAVGAPAQSELRRARGSPTAPARPEPATSHASAGAVETARLSARDGGEACAEPASSTRCGGPTRTV